MRLSKTHQAEIASCVLRPGDVAPAFHDDYYSEWLGHSTHTNALVIRPLVQFGTLDHLKQKVPYWMHVVMYVAFFP